MFEFDIVTVVILFASVCEGGEIVVMYFMGVMDEFVLFVFFMFLIYGFLFLIW